MGNEERVFTKAHKENIRKASFERESRIRTKVMVNGIVYGNKTRASEALGTNPRSLTRLLDSPDHPEYQYA